MQSNFFTNIKVNLYYQIISIHLHVEMTALSPLVHHFYAKQIEQISTRNYREQGIRKPRSGYSGSFFLFRCEVGKLSF